MSFHPTPKKQKKHPHRVGPILPLQPFAWNVSIVTPGTQSCRATGYHYGVEHWQGMLWLGVWLVTGGNSPSSESKNKRWKNHAKHS